jgi:hypothetical protein
VNFSAGVSPDSDSTLSLKDIEIGKMPLLLSRALFSLAYVHITEIVLDRVTVRVIRVKYAILAIVGNLQLVILHCIYLHIVINQHSDSDMNLHTLNHGIVPPDK